MRGAFGILDSDLPNSLTKIPNGGLFQKIKKSPSSYSRTRFRHILCSMPTHAVAIPQRMRAAGNDRFTRQQTQQAELMRKSCERDFGTPRASFLMFRREHRVKGKLSSMATVRPLNLIDCSDGQLSSHSEVYFPSLGLYPLSVAS